MNPRAEILNQIENQIPEAPEYAPPHEVERRTFRAGAFSLTVDFTRPSLSRVAEKIKRGYRRPKTLAPKRSLRRCIGGPFHGAKIVITDAIPSTAFFRVNGGKTGRYSGTGDLYWEERG